MPAETGPRTEFETDEINAVAVAQPDDVDSLLDEATRSDLTIRDTLALICEREIRRKDRRRIEMTLNLARFPFVRDLAGFDFAAQPSIDPKQVRDLAAARWIANGENVLLCAGLPAQPSYLRDGPPLRSRRTYSLALGGFFGQCWDRGRQLGRRGRNRGRT